MTAAQQTHPALNARSIDYARQLIRRRSITPEDAGCQKWLADKLSKIGFECFHLSIEGVSNLIASIGHGPNAVAFAGHTDVVPPGPLDKWSSPPFEARIQGNELIGRGAADMKTGVAAMLAAIERHLEQGLPVNRRFLFLITSDEEGEAEFGSKEIKAWLDDHQVNLDYCIVGEPTASEQTGDTVKVGRRGAISGRIWVKGKQGHVAYPQYSENAIHGMGDVLNTLNSISWDKGSQDFPGTSLQVTHIDSGAFTDNIVPGQCSLCFNVRYSDRYDEIAIIGLIEKRLAELAVEHTLTWERPCMPYLTPTHYEDGLITVVEQAIHKNTGRFPALSTSGGTSDGRFFASGDTQVVELGVPNKTIHQVNERIHIGDLATLEDIYTDLLESLLV
ncbi:Succinyl-diaminopimelate desuccinylase [Saliniradius amylolyticus]|uniref:Succinyl-diaminopimelate desuccinylase n=1 Tax=Saliniradius amylolyticus TaxID=2183582 RepID=A0A2S2E614_9ALTE|nr:succinyl-diaminopimelate desuccinylase [Saliniradius amylolyticus]AWL12680.1 Succinyl-diaminopimelate desuccinylase [Saliniradius amylolyticus]